MEAGRKDLSDFPRSRVLTGRTALHIHPLFARETGE